ncbi:MULTISPECIES: helix-turn-helix transcriptional regulator [Aeromonas]|uniref:helix-turn-helix transcriptional regulator n=1 Tax=Aeromonas TaxID=642 RepID=UPI002962127B|nr:MULTISPECIES: AlpA family phage regulatory protein [Aeromonas]
MNVSHFPIFPSAVLRCHTMDKSLFAAPSDEIRAQVLHCSGQCERLVREADRRAITGVTRTLWWKMEREGLAPKRVRLSIHCVAWRLSDLLWWIEQRKAA